MHNIPKTTALFIVSAKIVQIERKNKFFSKYAANLINFLNMIAIIPKDVLSIIPGINKLLNLGNITLFSGVWNQSEQKDKKDKANKNNIKK